MSLTDLINEHELIKIFCELAQIPSPSLKEEKVSQKIIELFQTDNINVTKDAYGNIIARVEATDKTKKPILLSAHMDVVGDASPVNIRLSEDGKCIETDKKRTLGADDKCGVACAIMLAKELARNKSIQHGGLEMIFTRDEEHNMTGIKNADVSNLKSEYVLVLDSSTLGEILVSGASFTVGRLNVKTAHGGHSGIDIGDTSRLNAVKLIAELMNEIPQGLYKKDATGTITSINAGAVVGGGINSSISSLLDNSAGVENYQQFIIENAMTNIINTSASAIYSIRSAEKDTEQKLLHEISDLVNKFNIKYDGLASATFETRVHLKPFEKSDDDYIEKIAVQAAKENNINYHIGSFHAGAETHIYKYLKNADNLAFKPYLIGIANIFNMHSSDEKVETASLLKGFEFLNTIFTLHNA